MIALRFPMKGMVLLFSICVVFGGSPVHSSFAQTPKDDKRPKQLENEKKKLSGLKDPADRAVSLMKIADITVTYVRDAITENDLPKMTACVDEYRKTVTEARDVMMGSGLNALKKPKGYRAIELATRGHLRILEDSARRLSLADREPLEEAIDEVSKIRNEMLGALFP